MFKSVGEIIKKHKKKIFIITSIAGLIWAAITQVFIPLYTTWYPTDTPQRQPVVSMSEIRADFLGNKLKQKDLDSEDEIDFVFEFKNTGLAKARVEYIKLKMFYGLLNIDEDKGIPIIQPMDMLGKLTVEPTSEQHDTKAFVPTANVTIFKDIVLLPQQPVEYHNLAHALDLKAKLYQINTSRPCPIIIESEIKYLDQEGSIYYYNSFHSLQWIAAHYNQFKAILHKSNTELDKPLHMTVRGLAAMLIDRLPAGERKKYFPE